MSKRRNWALITVILLVISGFGVFIYKYATSAQSWAMSPYNKAIYNNGVLAVGTLYDRNGVLLSGITETGERYLSDDWTVRVSNAHVTGDLKGNVGTGALSAFSPMLSGYNLLTGVGGDRRVYMTVDSTLNAVAHQALSGYNGTVAVCNYKTGEIICMVSSPTYDTMDPDGASGDGVYMNRFLSSTYTPGSVFKIVTLIAAVNEIPDLMEQTFNCDGSITVAGEEINCNGVHGEIGIEDAFAQSCNCAFAEIAGQLGGDTLKKYADELGITSSVNIDGINTAKGSFKISENDTETAWASIGQYKDVVNPAALLRIVCCIANDGRDAGMKLIKRSALSSFAESFVAGKRVLDSKTAEALSSMMNYNVYSNYGKDNFPGLELYAKSGTAEVGGGKTAHSWFTGFITNDNYPLAFVVVAENGGAGAGTAARIANTVLGAAVAR